MKNRSTLLPLLFAGLLTGVVAMTWSESEQTRWPWLVVGGFIATGCLFAFWWFCQDTALSLRWVIAGGLLLRVIFLPMSGELSDDYYRYLWDGALGRAGENPYLKLPVEVAASAPFQTEQRREWFANMNSPNYHSIYPPLSQFAFALAGHAGYWGLKIFFALVELGALLLLARLLNARQLLLYAWNPLLLLETWGQPHTEALAILFLAVALWAWAKRRRAVIASGAIVLAGWVKLFPLLLLPFLWRRMDQRDRLRSIGVFGVLSVAVWWPFLSVETFQNIAESSHLYMLSFEFNAGPYYAIKWLTTMPLRAIGWLGENQDTSKVVGPLMRVLLVAGLLWLWRVDRSGKRDFGRTVATVVGLFLVTFVNLHPWYLTFAVLGLPWMSPRWVAAWMWLCACSIGTYLSYSHDIYWPFVIAGWVGFAALMPSARSAKSDLATQETTTPRSMT